MTDRAVGTEQPCMVRRVAMTGSAEGRRAHEDIVGVALRAIQAGVRPGQRESGETVVKGGWRPG